MCIEKTISKSDVSTALKEYSNVMEFLCSQKNDKDKFKRVIEVMNLFRDVVIKLN